MAVGGVTRRCFVSAPADFPAGSLIEALRADSWDAFVLSDVASLGTPILDSLERAIRQADIVLALLPDESSGVTNVAFEAGLALGLGKPLILVSEDVPRLPTDLAGVLVVRADPGNTEAITFALDHAMGRLGRVEESARSPTGRPLGQYADVLLEQARALADDPEALVGTVLVKAIEASGAATVRSAGMDRGFDLGVWSDDLDALAGNPLLVEYKRTLSQAAVRQSLMAIHQTPTARLALIVHLHPPSSPPTGLMTPILAINLYDLLERMRMRSFAEVIRDLRNESAHARTV